MQSFGRRRSSRCDEEPEMIAYQCRTLVTMDAEPIADRFIRRLKAKIDEGRRLADNDQ